MPLTIGWDHRTDLSIIPLSAARSVTLLRGLASVLHGPNVLGGVVEIDLGRGPEAQRARDPLAVSAGLDQTGAGSLGVTTGTLIERDESQWVLRAGGGEMESVGSFTPTGHTVDLELPLPANLTLSGEYQLTDNWKVRAFVRDTARPAARELQRLGAELADDRPGCIRSGPHYLQDAGRDL